MNYWNSYLHPFMRVYILIKFDYCQQIRCQLAAYDFILLTAYNLSSTQVPSTNCCYPLTSTTLPFIPTTCYTPQKVEWNLKITRLQQHHFSNLNVWGSIFIVRSAPPVSFLPKKKTPIPGPFRTKPGQRQRHFGRTASYHPVVGATGDMMNRMALMATPG